MKQIVLLFLLLGLVSCNGGSSESSVRSENPVSPENPVNPENPTNPQNPTTPENPTNPKNPATKSPSNFHFAVIPDTQFYSESYPFIFKTQTQWIANNYKKFNIKFTAHLGDVVQNPDNDNEWSTAVDAMSLLDRNPETPYSILAGNHDITGIAWGVFDDAATNVAHRDINRNRDEERFIRFFPITKQEKNFSTLKGADETGLNSYHIFSDDDGKKYIVLALDWRVSDKTLDWVKSVLASHSNLPAILTTHELLDPRGISEGSEPAKWTSNGKRLWDKLIKSNDQIFITFNGHWNGEGYRIEKNEYGRKVLLIGVDYQNEYNGGNGMLQLVEFDKKDNKLNFRSYSPYVQKIMDTSKGEIDERNILNRWKFSYPLDFKVRLNNFNQK